MSETSCVNATVAVVGNPTSNKGKGTEVGNQVIGLLREAGRAPGPYAGIPVAIKDLCDIAGEPTPATTVIDLAAYEAAAKNRNTLP